jgi:hypothetical protein
MTKKLIEIASEIVQAQESITRLSGADIASSLKTSFVYPPGDSNSRSRRHRIA